MKVLIAEDERITRRNLQRQFESWGHEVVAVEDGVAAWDQFQQGEFEIVVTDWDMPRLDGQELIKRIRGSDRVSYAYLIMLTGRSEKTDLVSGMEAGADDFLAKPFDKNELRVRLSAGERIIRLERTLASRNEELSNANERMKRDLEAAARAQHDLLPKKLPESLKANFAWYYKPCDELGGDILNVLPLDEDHVALYLIDVSGHGVPAALLSVTLSRVLTTRDPTASILVTKEEAGDALVVASPQRVAGHLNRQFPMESNSGHYFTMSFAVLDTKKKMFHYINAGHPEPVLMRRGEDPRLLSGGSFPIGIVAAAEYEDETIQLEPGDRLWFYSDGITEATNDRDEMLNIDGLIKMLRNHQTGSLSDDLTSCIDEFSRWCGRTQFGDDVSMLALELPPAD